MADTTLRTAGENLVHRRLRTEQRAGVLHYVPGQLEVTVTDPEVLHEVGHGDAALAAQISYVDAMGNAVVVILLQDPDEGGAWIPQLSGRAGVATFGGYSVVPKSWRMTDEMRGKLEEALAEVAT